MEDMPRFSLYAERVSLVEKTTMSLFPVILIDYYASTFFFAFLFYFAIT